MVVTYRTCSALLAVALAVLTMEVCADMMNKGLLRHIEDRHTEYMILFDQEKIEECVEFCTVDIIYMPHMGAATKGREALLRSYEELWPDVQLLIPQGIVYSEMLSENAAIIYLHSASVDKSGKQLALYRSFMIWKEVDDEWYIDKLIFNNRPLNDLSPYCSSE